MTKFGSHARRRASTLSLSSLLLGLLGCGPGLKFTGIGEAREPKPPTCPITLLTATPAEPYQELGTIEIQYDTVGFISKPEELKKALQPEVCRVGGDAALGIANSYGTYIKAKVFSAQAKAVTKREAEPNESGGEQTATPEELGEL